MLIHDLSNEDEIPQPDYKKLRKLSEEFYHHWRRLQALYLDAAVGFGLVRKYVEAEQAQARAYVRGSELDSEEFQNKRTFVYNDDILIDGFCTSAIHEATQGDVKLRNSHDGANFTTLGQLCITSFYDYWEDYLRRNYAIAIGRLSPHETNKEVVESCLRKFASNDLWGDLYHLRTSIVHNQGIATSKVERCKIIKWFKPQEFIAVGPEHMRELFLALLTYRNSLCSESFPRTTFTI